MVKRYPDQERLNKLQIRRIATRFEQTGLVADKLHTNPGRPKSVCACDDTILNNLVIINDVISC